MKLCSVCVNTYKRPRLLADLLDSLARQVVSEQISMEVIVVDNDKEETARSVVQDAAVSSLDVRYFVEPIQNISLARNKAVSEARGAYILFIDDDERARSDWLQTMVDTVELYQADGAFGRVIPEFDDTAPQWIKDNYIFHTPRGATGSRTKIYGTGNVIILAECLSGEDPPFDPKYGRSGGEDSDLFRRLSKKGAKFVDCYESVVTEYQPVDRTRPEWLVERARRTGALYAEGAIESSKRKILVKFFICLKALVFYIYSLIMRFFVIFNKSRQFHYRVKMSAYLGHIMGVFGKKMVGY